MHRRLLRLPLLTLTLGLLSLACFALPLYVIRPFRRQEATELAVALLVKRIGPWISAACALLALGFVTAGWRQTRGRASRSLAVLGLALTVLGAYLARFNIYEVMFHPLGVPRFSSVAQAHLEKNDMVLAVRVNNVARAYPIREIAYHHIVNDTVGGVPIVATY